MVGYVRQSAAQISSGQPVASAPVNNEFNQLQSAFSGTSGHAHSGSTGDGPQLTSAAFGISTATAGIVAATGSLGAFAAVTLTGTTNQITVTNGTGAAGNPTFSIATGYVGQASITTLGTITSGIWNGTPVGATYGGTGVNNGSNTITLGGNLSTAAAFATSGAFGLTLVSTAATSATLPTGTTTLVPTTGTGATGTWGISISGTAATVTTNANLTGDVTSTGNATTLATVNSNTGSFGSASTVPAITVNGKGLITAVTSTTITPSAIGAPTTTGTGASGTWGISITGNAATATAASSATTTTGVTTTAVTTNASFFPLFASSSTNGNQAVNLGTGLSFNPSTNNLTTTTFSGSLSGSLASGTTGVTPAAGDNSTKVITSAFLQNFISVQATAKNLRAAWASNTTATWQIDQIILQNAGLQPTLALNINLTVNSATSGAGGLDTGTISALNWYYVYVIYNGTTINLLMSLSSTTPTMPTGYTYKARVGTILVDSAAHFVGFVQYGKRVQFVVGSNLANLPVLASGSAGNTSTPTWVSVAVGGAVPATASRIVGILSAGSASAANAMVAPNSFYGAFNSTTNPPPLVITSASGINVPPSTFDFALEGANIFWASSAGASSLIQAFGYEDNL